MWIRGGELGPRIARSASVRECVSHKPFEELTCGHAHALPFAAKTLGFVRDVLSHLFIFDAIAWQCISDGEIPHGRGLFVLLLYICLCPHGRGVLVPMVGMKFHLQKKHGEPSPARLSTLPSFASVQTLVLCQTKIYISEESVG